MSGRQGSEDAIQGNSETWTPGLSCENRKGLRMARSVGFTDGKKFHIRTLVQMKEDWDIGIFEFRILTGL